MELISNAKQQIKYLEKLHKLYLVELSLGKEVFIKIGITTHSNIIDRFKNYTYQVKVIDFIELDGEKARAVESLLKERILAKHRYSPRLKMDGWSECFKLEIKDELIEIYRLLKEHYNINDDFEDDEFDELLPIEEPTMWEIINCFANTSKKFFTCYDEMIRFYNENNK
jgi:hypothetical protein